MAGDHGIINPNAFKRRLLRAAVQENVRVMAGEWPRLTLPQPTSRPTWLTLSVVIVVVCTLAPLWYVAATVAKAPHEIIQASPSMATETKLDLAFPDPVSSVTAIAPMSVASKIELSSSDSTSAGNVLPEMLSVFQPASVDADLLLSEPRPLDVRAFALAARKIVIDPGHGGEDPGAIAAHGLTEKDIALDVGLRLRALLTASSFEVRMTREKDETRSLVRRAAFANEEGGDLFVSIHVNWVEPRRARVVETYYLGPTEDAAALQIAGTENHQSGYSLADFRRLLEGVYTDVKRSESRKLAEAIQGELIRTLHPTNRSSAPHAVKTAPFAVLIGTTMPAILTEVSCLSNKEEAQLLATPEYRQQIAQALFAGLRAYSSTLEQAYVMRKESPS